MRKSSIHCIVLLLLSAGSSPSKEPLEPAHAMAGGDSPHCTKAQISTVGWDGYGRFKILDDLSIAKSFLVKQAKFGVRGSVASRFAKTKSEAIASGTATPVVGTISRHCSRICAMVLQAWLVMAYLIYAYSP